MSNVSFTLIARKTIVSKKVAKTAPIGVYGLILLAMQISEVPTCDESRDPIGIAIAVKVHNQKKVKVRGVQVRSLFASNALS